MNAHIVYFSTQPISNYFTLQRYIALIICMQVLACVLAPFLTSNSFVYFEEKKIDISKFSLLFSSKTQISHLFRTYKQVRMQKLSKSILLVQVWRKRGRGLQNCLIKTHFCLTIILNMIKERRQIGRQVCNQFPNQVSHIILSWQDLSQFFF